jgi:hypothetical protein
MRRERPTDCADPPTDRHDASQDIVAWPGAQRQFVETVDLLLDVLGECEVAGEDLVDDGRHERRRVEGTEPRIAMPQLVDPVQGRGRAGMDGDHPIPPGDEVDLDPLGTDRLTVADRFAGRPPLAIHRLEHEVDVVGVLREVGASLLRLEAAGQRGSDPDRGGHGVEIRSFPARDVDPQQPSV